MSLFIIVPVAIIVYAVGLVAFILWIVSVVSEDARRELTNFLNFIKLRDSAAAYTLLTPELQDKSGLATFERNFVNGLAPELSNYAGLSYNRVKMQGSQARLGGTLKGSGQPYSVHLVKRDNIWRIASFSIGNFTSDNLVSGQGVEGVRNLQDAPNNALPLQQYSPPSASATKRTNSKSIKLFVIVPLILIVYAGGLLGFILWIVGLASEDAYKEFDNFVNATKQRDTVAAYALLTPELQSTYAMVTFESEFVNQLAPELSNYAGLDGNSTSVRNSVARLSGTLKGSGQAYSVRLINRDNKWKITGFSIGRFRAGTT
jgi:flagellar basal body-associated protein FliL